MVQNYSYEYHTYPVLAEEFSSEGAVTRFMPMPGPAEVFQRAMLGLPRVLPLTGEVLTPEMLVPYLNSAIAEIEHTTDLNISEVTHWHSEDYVAGKFDCNYLGIKLAKIPATSIVQMQLKFPHTNLTSPIQRFSIPPGWISLNKNRIVVVAAIGNVAVSTDSAALATLGGLLTILSGFGRGSYQPAMIEVVYTAGFKHDRLPASVADLITTWATYRFLTDITPVLFPNSGVSVSIDGVAQSVQLNIPQMLTQRLTMLDQKRKELSAAITKQFSQTIKTTYIGA